MSQAYEAFGKFILLEKLAMGGMAEVYLARNTGADGIGKFIAIKRILPQFSEDPAFVDMFKDEAKIAVNLAHSNIVSIHEFGVEKNQFFLVMDYVEGRDLRRILNKMKKSGLSLSVEQVLYIIKEVAAGLDSAHRCLDRSSGKPLNINHRDISPQNVMISFEGEVKIVDFGIAKAETQIETTRAGTLKGKFGYMSPEQAEGQVVDLRTDIFSLGIVLWELLANDRLFVANNEVNILRKIRECQIPSLRKINPNIPAELERICNKALARDRNLRYQTAAAFHRDLSRFLNRQFPDFSPHDFSVFIKTLFATEILEHRKKIVDFSKDAREIVPAQRAATTAPLDQKPNNSDTLAEPTRPAPRANPPPPLEVETPPPARELTTPEGNTDIEHTSNSVSESAFFENSEFSTDTNAKPKPEPLKPFQPEPPPALLTKTSKTATETVEKSKPIPSIGFGNNEPKTPKKVQQFDKPDTKDLLDLQVDRSRRPRSETAIGIREGTFTSSGYGRTGTYTRIRERNRIGEIVQQSFMALAVLIILACLGLYANNPIKFQENVKKYIAEYTGKEVVPQGRIDNASGKPDATPAPTFRVTVSSQPPSAEIWIDGKLHSDVTPTRIEFQGGKEYNVAIRKEGFKPYQQRLTFDGDTRVAATLSRAKVAYLNIVVEGAGEIFVNNEKIAITGPVQDYMINADEEVVVRAYDPRTGASDQTAPFKLGEGFSKQVRLQPKMQAPMGGTNKRVPSSRR